VLSYWQTLEFVIAGTCLLNNDEGDVRSRQDMKGDKGKMVDRPSIIDLDLGDEVFPTLQTWAQGED
jgi:hypothetical protein